MSAKQDNYYNLAERIEDAFTEIDSDVCTDLRNGNDEYAEKWREAISLQDAFPIIQKAMDGEDEISMSAEEHKALCRYLGLKHRMENMERKQIYFRGHTDNFAYLKKIGVI